ncbi:MAG TPA: hypothetical protein VH062_35010 [Polyangiaceae bacterium]|jgi:hypothetical protein|nr:hypothetical protein [Polyangiaceae bacterium]
MRPSLVVVLAVSLASCAGPAETRGLSVVAPTSLGEGHNEGHALRPNTGTGLGATSSGTSPARARLARDTDGGVPETVNAPTEHGTQPDPTPLVTLHQWDLALHYAKGKVKVDGVKAVELPNPVATPRRMGRFSVELWVGRELVDRVRFDFPLLGADWPPGADTRPVKGAPRFSPGADTVSTVRVPASERATSAVVVDRLTGDVTPIPWPPAGPASGPPAP